MFNDRLDDLFTGEKLATPRTAKTAPEGYRPAEQMFTEGCPKCRGTGQTRWGVCFRCKGKGGQTFKTSPEARAKARDSRAARQDRVEADSVETFKQQYPAEAAWLLRTADRWPVAAQWLVDLKRFGDLTEGKLAAIRKCMAKDAAREADRAQRAGGTDLASTEGVDKLKEAFDKAIAFAAERGLTKAPKITVDGITISPAKATSANPGAIYVKVRGGDYLGKIAGGKFFATRECTEEQKIKVLAFVTNPSDAAKVYGQETGICCVCNATLKSAWRLRGIGPVCAEKYGW
jgi:hypothetical protein